MAVVLKKYLLNFYKLNFNYLLDTCAKSYFLLQVSKIQIKLLKNTLKIILFLFFLLSAQNLIITKKTVKSIVFINHTKLYCRKISFFLQRQY